MNEITNKDTSLKSLIFMIPISGATSAQLGLLHLALR